MSSAMKPATTVSKVCKNPWRVSTSSQYGLMKLGLTVFQRNELREAARSLLQRLSEEMDATAHMAIFEAPAASERRFVTKAGSVVAAISISMPAARFYAFPEPRLAILVKNTAAALSFAAGHCGEISYTHRH